MKRFAVSILLSVPALCGLVSVTCAGVAEGVAEEPANLRAEQAQPGPGTAVGIRPSQLDLRDVSVEVKLKNGAVVLGGIVAETESQMTLSSWQRGGSRQVVVNNADIAQVTDHLAERQLIMDRATKARIERDLTAAGEEVANSQKEIEKAMKALNDLARQRPSSLEAAKPNPELDRQQTRLRLELKGSKIAVVFVQARVTALQNELHRVDQRIAELEKRSWKAR